MTVLELALLGVRNFQQIARLEFSPGLNFIQGGNGSGKTTLREAILFSLLGHTSEQAKSLVHHSSPSTCQVALTFKTKDGELYRLATDYIKDISFLSKHDPSIQKFIPFEKRKENVLRWIQQQCGGLDENQVHRFFTLERKQMPSLSAGPARSHQAGASISVEHQGLETGTEIQRPRDPSAKLRRLQELKAMAEKAEQAFQIEEQLSEAKSRAGILKRKLNDLARVDQELEQINEKVKIFSGLEGSMDQIQEGAEEFEKKLAERNREYQTLDEDRNLLEHQLSLIPTDPIYKNKAFIAGALTTILSFGTGLLMTLPGLYQHLYLVGLLIGLGLMVVSVIVDMRWHSRKKILEEKLHNKLKNMELLEARFRRENLKFFDILKKTNTDSVDAFKEKIKNYDLLQTTRSRLLEDRGRILEGKGSVENLEKEYGEKSNLIQELDKKMKGHLDTSSDLPSLQEEIRTLERELASTLKGTPYSALRTDRERKAGGSSRTDSAPKDGNGSHSLKAFMQNPFVRDRDQFLNTAQEILRKLSLGAYPEIKIDEASEISLIPNGSPTPVSLTALSHGTLDQVFLSFFLGLLLNIGAEYFFPVLLDDPLLTLDPKRQQAALEILREISQKRQVFLLSCLPYPVREGECQIRLP